MTKTLRAMALLLVGVFAFAFITSAQITNTIHKPIIGSVVNYTFFVASTTDTALATTTSATSTGMTGYFDTNGALDNGKLNIAGAEKVTFYFGRSYGGGNAGNSQFKVQVSDDGTNWYDFSKLRGADVSSTATSTYTIVASTSTVPVSLDLTYDTHVYARCIVVETTDGTHACRATVEY